MGQVKPDSRLNLILSRSSERGSAPALVFAPGLEGGQRDNWVRVAFCSCFARRVKAISGGNLLEETIAFYFAWGCFRIFSLAMLVL
jgi:hypothetical protein